MNRKSAWKDGIFIVGIYLMLLLAVLLVPVLNIVAIWVLPLPVVYFAVKHGIKSTLILYLILCLIAWPIHVIALVLTFVFAMVGGVIGELHRRKADGFAVLIGASLAYIFHLLSAYVVFTLGFEMSMRQVIRSQHEQVTELLEQTGRSTDQISILLEGLDMMVYMVPFMMVLVGASLGLLTVWLAGIMLRRFNIETNRLPALRNWGFPKAFIWYYLIAFVVMLTGPEEGSTLFLAITNVFILIETIMTIQGLSFILFFFHHKKLPKILGILVVVMCIIIAPLQQIIRLVGIADLVLDLKSRLGSQRK
ncbi:YybS family protein [Alkalicoccobacillus murimartini]|uniref:Uncharacterized protein YybS (DUF2232 family) n=1 Tax=Alkalicoccobacillus murimartini TaxID=171685 RepID=A0ABT9YML0_9BACI|nr:DUF2232 domain-containing protein [Alkalicoccobacillus murimartini]MDQ0209121.1 uncharacterized protein YybS (DUF2232 family) [Alkalicoccobacillus murimartini]